MENKISVTISTHNRINYLLRLINSIEKQSYENYEIVIIDDASTDNTQKIIISNICDREDSKIRYYRQKKNEGVSKCKRDGYSLCSGDIIIFSDDDDYYIDTGYFEKLNKIYNEHPDCVMTVASTNVYYEENERIVPDILNLPEEQSTRDYLNGFMRKLKKPNSMFTLSLNARILKENNYKNLKYFNDTSLYLYALLFPGIVVSINEVVGNYSISIKRMTNNVSSSYTIGNLDSKFDIYDKACNQNLLDEPNQWLYNQSMPTIMNYIGGSYKTKNELADVLDWVYEKFSLKYRMKFYRALLICQIKNKFRKKKDNGC